MFYIIILCYFESNCLGQQTVVSDVLLHQYIYCTTLIAGLLLMDVPAKRFHSDLLSKNLPV